nr:capsular polysaccharide synthesis protein [Lachnospiraceae bacterium]
CHILQQEMLGEYKEKRWNQIMKMSGIHKLTYKYDQELDIRGSMLEYLLVNETV